MAIIKNCRIKFGSVTQKDKFNEDKISVKFFIEDKKEEKALIAAIDTLKDGIDSKVQHFGYKKYKNDNDENDKDIGKNLFTAWCYAKKWESEDDFLVPMYTAGGAEYEEKKRPNLSWGSIINISLTPKVWEMKSDHGVKLMLQKVQVITPVLYDGGDEFTAAEGFEDDVVEESTKKKKKKKKNKT